MGVGEARGMIRRTGPDTRISSAASGGCDVTVALTAVDGREAASGTGLARSDAAFAPAAQAACAPEARPSVPEATGSHRENLTSNRPDGRQEWYSLALVGTPRNRILATFNPRVLGSIPRRPTPD